MTGFFLTAAMLLPGQVAQCNGPQCAQAATPSYWVNAPAQVTYQRPVYQRATYQQPVSQPVQYTYQQASYRQPVQYTYQQPVQYTYQQPGYTYQQTTQQTPTYYQQTTQASYYGSGDAYGFLSWLNGVRAQYGLGACSYDSNLEAWASQNNAAQSARGLGHFVMGPARRQNSAMSGGFPGQMWMNSPGHRAAILDPTITRIGLAFNGSYWTMNAN